MVENTNAVGDPDPPDGTTGGNSAIKQDAPDPSDVQAYQQELGDPDPPDGTTSGTNGGT